MTDAKKLIPSKVLPADAVAQLQRAALTPITAADPLARVKAIEQTTRRIKVQHPQFFKVEKHES
jgi:hypothetical protein